MFKCEIISASHLVVVAIHWHCNSQTMMIESGVQTERNRACKNVR